MDSSDLTQLSEEIIKRLGSGGDLDGMISSELLQQEGLYMSNQDDSNSNVAVDNEIIMHMDIREPLRTLQKLLEKKVGLSLEGYEFWLQDTHELEPHKNLVGQCIEGEGLIQINVEIKYIIKRINILDVLKPTEDALAALTSDEANKTDVSTDDEMAMHNESRHDYDSEESKSKRFKRELTLTSPSTVAQSDKPCLNWVLDNKFRKEQLRLKIPDNPTEWSVSHVKFWFQWAVQQFELAGTNMNDWCITGSQLCSLSHEEFSRKLPKDPDNLFWTHLQLLKECKFVSVILKSDVAEAKTEEKRSVQDPVTLNIVPPINRELKIMRKTYHNLKKEAILHEHFNAAAHGLSGTSILTHNTYGIGSDSCGQVQLWQFLLEILTDRQHTKIIQWIGDDGEFTMTNPELVARLWGEKKNKPAMNYAKLSRALRYYYDGDMISKVSGKRFSYKFDCDLKLLIGYTASELSALVNEKSFIDESLHHNSEDTKADVK